MFIRSFAAIVLILPALAGAIGILRPNSAITSTNGIPPTTGTQATTIDQCNTGPIQCCNSVQSADSSIVIELLNSVGAIVTGPDTPIGLSCSPLTAVEISAGSSCSAQPVCCTNNSFRGIVAIGCTPVNVVLRRDLGGDSKPVFASTQPRGILPVDRSLEPRLLDGLQGLLRGLGIARRGI